MTAADTSRAESHLGGYVTGGDEATWFPELWAWLVREHGTQRVLDVGCGEGQALDWFTTLGCYVQGVEGTPQTHEKIVQHDYTEGPYTPCLFDLVWCCEFVEHVEERYLPNVLASFKAAPLVLMTHAFPGQDGYHHVNCQPPEYWIGVMAAIGYGLDEKLTSYSRFEAARNTSPWNHFTRSGLAFRKRP